ncbi:TraB/GumN family protein [Persicobacter sp. CCB-QB2]|uniref:TraB/GumN family protein n=1 Tax=Persicobacter sp. CCB-QB2 TaxID=1561025 RepID=UPI0006A97B09|nr:TraB/GumN family protein [Persicobacter sp. CCB-QB2]
MRKHFLLFFILLISQTLTLAQSLLWEVSGNGQQEPSYLYGTIHLQEEKLFVYSEQVKDYINKCEQAAFELDMQGDQLIKAAQMMMYPGNEKITDHISTADFQKILKVFEKSQFNSEILKKFKPMGIYSLMVSLNRAQDMEESMDLYFQNYAISQNKPLFAIETIEEQMAAFDDFDTEMLMEAVAEFGQRDKELKKLSKYYLKGNIKELAKIETKNESEEELSDKLFTKRNVTIANRLDEQFRQQSTMALFGAGHLGGDDGVIALLKQKGWKVSPVKMQVNQQKPKSSGTVWKDYSQDTAHYAVLFPQKPQVVTQTVQSEIGPLEVISMVVSKRGKMVSNYNLTMTTYPEGTVHSNMTSRLDQIFDGGIGAMLNQLPNAQILEKSSIEKAGFPGRDVKIKAGEETIILNYYLVNNKMYLVMASTFSVEKGTQDLSEFFGGFEIKDQKDTSRAEIAFIDIETYSDNEDWFSIEDEDIGYAIQFPTTPVTTHEEVDLQGKKTVVFSRISFDTDSTVMFNMTDFPYEWEAENYEELSLILEAELKSMLDTDYQDISDFQYLNFADYFYGAETTAKVNGNDVKIRLWISNNHMFVLQYLNADLSEDGINYAEYFLTTFRPHPL